MRSASVGIWVGVGSRDETPALAGTSHFLEHLLFKGTRSRSALDIAYAMDAVGGEFNAFTEKEHTCYYATVLDRDLPLAIDIVSDVVLEATVRSDDIEVERSVVLEEIAMRDDDPADRVHDEFNSALFGPTPLGRPILGSVESINALTRVADRRLLPAPLPAAVDDRRRGRQPRPRVRRCATCGGRSPTTWTRRPRLADPRRSPTAARARPSYGRDRRRHRAGQSRARHAGALAPRRSPLRPRRAQRGGGGRHELAAVPEHPRAAGPGLLGLLVHHQLHRRRPVRRVRRLPAQPRRRGDLADQRRPSPASRAAGSPPTRSNGARGRCAAGSCSASRTAARA